MKLLKSLRAEKASDEQRDLTRACARRSFYYRTQTAERAPLNAASFRKSFSRAPSSYSPFFASCAAFYAASCAADNTNTLGNAFSCMDIYSFVSKCATVCSQILSNFSLQHNYTYFHHLILLAKLRAARPS